MFARLFAIFTVTAVFGTAGAATIELNFADGLGNREADDPLIYEDGGVTVTVSALAGQDPRAVHINGEAGLGVAGNTVFFEGNRIGRGESLVFEFSQPVVFDQLIGFDEITVTTPIFFAVFVDDALADVFTLREDVDNFQRVDLSGIGEGSVLRIIGLFGSEGFRVTALRAETTVIPVPGGIVLLGAALASLVTARRRRR